VRLSGEIPGAVVLGDKVVVRRAFLAARRNGSPGASGRGVPRGLRRQWKTVRRFRGRGTVSGNIAARQRGCRWVELVCNKEGREGRRRNDRSHFAHTRQRRDSVLWLMQERRGGQAARMSRCRRETIGARRRRQPLRIVVDPKAARTGGYRWKRFIQFLASKSECRQSFLNIQLKSVKTGFKKPVAQPYFFFFCRCAKKWR